MPGTGIWTGLRRSARIGIASALAAAAGALAAAAPASAVNLFTLDAHPDSQGNVVMDSSGNVYVAWNTTGSSGGADTPMFCKFALGSRCTSPISLQLQGPNTGDETDTVADFPIVNGTTVYVVGPRYIDNDTIVWTSTDGGATFDGGTLINNNYDQTGAENVLLQGSNFLIGSVNVGLAFDSTPIDAAPGADQTFAFSNPGSGGVSSGSLAVDQNGNPVEAYWNLSDPSALDYFYYTGSGDPDSQANWAGPVSLGIGQNPSLAGGSSGLYLLSANGSLPSNPDDPTSVGVRSYNATSHTFGSPVTLLRNPESGFDEGGGLALTPGGKVVAIWPDNSSSGDDVLDSFVSTNSGATWLGPYYVATRSGYDGQAQVAAIDQGSNVKGVVAFNDDDGLEVTDLTPLPSLPPATVAPSATSSGSSVTLTITCAAACTVTITITIDPPAMAAAAKKTTHKTVTLASGKFTLKHGGEGKLTLKLTRAGKSLLAKAHGHLKANTLTVDKTLLGTLQRKGTLRITTKHK